MKPARLILLGFVLLALLGVSLGLVLTSGASRSRTLVLSDGTRLHFEGIHFNGTNQAPPGNIATKALAKIFPKGIHIGPFQWQPSQFPTINFGNSDYLVLWFTSNKATPNPGPGHFWLLTLKDGQGMEWSALSSLSTFPSGAITAGTNAAKGPNFSAVFLQSFPRRGKSLLVEIREFDFQKVATANRASISNSSVYKKLGELRITNPSPGPFPSKREQPLPAVFTTTNVNITLKGWQMEKPNPGAGFFQLSQANQQIELTIDGREASEYEFAGLTIFDSTGNRVQASINQNPPSGPRKPGVHTFHADFDPAGPVTADLVLSRKQNFKPEDLVRFEKIKNPARTGSQVTLSTNIAGGTLRVYVFQNQISAHFMPNGLNFTVAGARKIPLTRDEKLISLVRIESSSGTVHRNDFGFGIQPNQGNFSMVIPSEAETIDFELAVFSPVTAKFVVQPRLVEKLGVEKTAGLH